MVGGTAKFLANELVDCKITEENRTVFAFTSVNSKIFVSSRIRASNRRYLGIGCPIKVPLTF